MLISHTFIITFSLFQSWLSLHRDVRTFALYLSREDVFDLCVFRGVRTRDVRVAAAADSGLEEHSSHRGRRGPAHGAVTDVS